MLVPVLISLGIGVGVGFSLFWLFNRRASKRGGGQEGPYYRAVLEAIPDEIFFLDEKGAPVQPAILKKAFPEKYFQGLFPSDLVDVHQEAYQRVLDGGGVECVAYQLTLPEGVRDFEARLVAVQDDQVMCLVRDITERKRAARRLSEKVQELAALQAISNDMTAGVTLEDLLQTSVIRSVELLEGVYGAIYLKDQRGGRYIIRAEEGARDLPGTNLGDCCHQLAEDMGSWRGSRKIHGEELRNTYSSCANLEDAFAVLVVPLKWKAEVIGVITVWIREDEKRSNQDGLVLLNTLANQITIAVRNVQLLEKQEAQILLSETMHEMGALLTGQMGLDEVLDEVLNLLDRVVSFDSASILLMGEEGKLHLAASRGIEKVEEVKESLVEKGGDILPLEWMERKTAYIPDTKKSDQWVRIPATSYIRSWIGAVLYGQEAFIGLLNVDNKALDAYDSEDMRMVRTFADQAAIAIENARLFEERRISHHRLQVLYDLNRQLAETLDRDLIIHRSTTIACQALEGDVSDYFLYHQDSDQVQLISSVGRTDGEIQRMKDRLIPKGDTWSIRWVLENRRSMRASNVLEDERWDVIPHLNDPIRSVIIVPVFIDEQISGAISVLHEEEGAFSEEHEDLLKAISHQMGLALNNAYRYKEVEHLLEALETRQEMQNTLFEHLPVGVLLLDEKYNILSSNELGGKFVRELSEDGSLTSIERLGNRTLDELLLHHQDPRPLEIRKKDGETRVYEAQIRQVYTVSESYWVLMIDDVTWERERERRLQMQERLATMGQFAAGVAHDFNNIVSAILVYTDVLKRDEEMSDQNMERIDVIQSQTRRASDLIRQILDFSRHSVIEYRLFNFVPLLEEVKKLLERMLPENIQIRLEMLGDIPELMVHGDPTRIQQMIMNLALNSRDAMPEGGEILIQVGTVEVTEYEIPPLPSMEPGEWIQLLVSDQGVGIPDQEIPHVFEPFYTTKESPKGTGLGLAQVYGIVKQHEGYIDVESEVGRGTTFSIYIPLVKESELTLAPPDESMTVDGKEALALIVEDDESLRNALWHLFEECNFQVILATNGERGLEILEQVGDRVSIVVTDLVMPKMGGIEMYRKARDLYPDKKFLFITGHQKASRKVDLIDDPFVRRLQKPFTMGEILRQVKELQDSGPPPVKR
ncbi:MAG: GAF domain-containing protein [Anaerolineales bacterium]